MNKGEIQMFLIEVLFNLFFGVMEQLITIIGLVFEPITQSVFGVHVQELTSMTIGEFVTSIQTMTIQEGLVAFMYARFIFGFGRRVMTVFHFPTKKWKTSITTIFRKPSSTTNVSSVGMKAAEMSSVRETADILSTLI